MQYDVQITFDDYKAAQKLHLKKTRIRVCFYFLLGLIVCVAINPLDFSDALLLLFSSLRDVMWTFIVLFILYWLYSKELKKSFPKIQRYEFTQDDFRVTTNYTLPINWQAVCKWEEDKSLFLVYQPRHLFRLVPEKMHIIPKRIFPDQEALDQLRNILTEKIGKPAK
jgi:hypothetical protein